MLDLNATFFTDEEKVEIGNLFASYTADFAPESVQFVESFCFVISQSLVSNNVSQTNTMDYSCAYSSRVVDVETFPGQFLDYVNGNLTMVTEDLQALNLSVIESLEATFVKVPTNPPTVSAMPSESPSNLPTISAKPSRDPTASPTEPERIPTAKPSIGFIPVGPTAAPSVPVPVASSSGLPIPVIVSVTVLGGVAILIALIFFYRQRRKKRQAARMLQRAGAADNNGYYYGKTKDGVDSAAGVGAMSPGDSVVSNQSLVSEGDSGLDGESGDEMDGTKNLQDEFDQYKDQNLEQLRTNVEGNLTGFEGVMSAAVTKALMGDDIKIDQQELLWGCTGNPAGAEIEASALCEVSDWLKKNESASMERRNAFMADVLNRIFTSTHHGVLDSEDASRTIHESAALLGLPLAHELPAHTLIISGMRKTVQAQQIVKVLGEFGEIDKAAVASGGRGFGIVRFRYPKIAERVMRKYTKDEIVIEDVSVQMSVLTPNGEVLRALY